MSDTIFGKIIKGELPAEKLFENDRVIVIKDIHPCAPVHLLIISKKEIKDLQSVTPQDMPIVTEMIEIAQRMAHESGIENGYRLITNNGPTAGQIIFHLHFHLIGGRQLGPLDA
ncbi:MAG: histidine triad nucleotide-binding protein [Parachlamydiaceae bacterium]|nr:histidine triad nucleotide-binding protein [Parachlamydiaceae bacterium]